MSASPVSERERKILGIIETARGKRPKFRDERITMAHGAGGKATQTLIEGLFLPVLGGEALGALAPGDRILLSGRIGDHGTAIMLARGEFDLDAEIESDTRSLWPAVDALLDACGPELRCLRDATRGGVASVLNELARGSSVAMLVREGAVPLKPAVPGAAEL